MTHQQSADSNQKYFTLKVTEDISIMNFLKIKLAQQSATSLKLLFKNKNILLNNKQIISQFDYKLKKGDMLYILSAKSGNTSFSHPKLKIVYEDEAIIIINKKEGLLSVGTQKQQDETAYNMLNNYIKSKDKHKQIYLLHRLDRDTSGIMMFAKSKEIQTVMQENWNNIILERTYIALVHGTPIKTNDTIISYLTEDKSTKMHSHKENYGQKAVTSYRVVETNKSFSLLELELQTGRKNQIRIHLQSIGHPILGDKKYGNDFHKQERLFLHAKTLSFKHPISNEIMKFEIDVPNCFYKLLQINK